MAHDSIRVCVHRSPAEYCRCGRRCRNSPHDKTPERVKPGSQSRTEGSTDAHLTARTEPYAFRANRCGSDGRHRARTIERMSKCRETAAGQW